MRLGVVCGWLQPQEFERNISWATQAPHPQPQTVFQSLLKFCTVNVSKLSLSWRDCRDDLVTVCKAGNEWSTWGLPDVHKGQLFITCTSTKIKFIVQIHIHVLKIEVTIHNGNIKPILAYKMEWKFHSGIITSKTLDTPLTCPWPLGVTNNEPHILIMKNKPFLLWVTNPFSYHEYQIHFPTMNIEPLWITNPFFYCE